MRIGRRKGFVLRLEGYESLLDVEISGRLWPCKVYRVRRIISLIRQR